MSGPTFRGVVIHQAAPAKGLVQKCALCGETLIDRRNEARLLTDTGLHWFAGSVEVEPGQKTASELEPNCVNRRLVQFQ